MALVAKKKKMMMMSHIILSTWLWLLLLILLPRQGTCDVTKEEVVIEADGSSSSSEHSNKQGKETDEPPPMSPNCRLVMAPSTLQKQTGETTGWGIFTTVKRQHGRPVYYGDVVVQVVDLDTNPFAMAISGLAHDYFWSAEETGGFYEGQHVVSSFPGIAMLANGLPSPLSNVLPFVPTIDEGGLTRSKSPGAGAITHYHNFSFFVQEDLEAGQELFVNYGAGWFEERKQKLVLEKTSSSTTPSSRSVDWLRQHGRCLDNIRPGKSTTKDAGRGAFATRRLPTGSIVAPVPVAAIADRRALDIVRQRQDGTNTTGLKQLLLNYCFGHADSSVLLYPYGPMVHLVNHGGRGKYANVELRWSTLPQAADPASVTVTDLIYNQPHTFLLELVALRDIKPKEEILLDYGTDWIDAWVRHLDQWEPYEADVPYAPSYVQDDVVKALRTEEELKIHPYPENVFTSCFYRYSDHKNDANSNNNDKANSGSGVTSIRWKQTRAIFEYENLRPCKILQRQQDPKLGTIFTVQIRNRYGMRSSERLPKGTIHIVTGVPRHAIRFSDKLYTTDQHLENAFRHEIGIPDSIFPEHWKNLKNEKG